MILVYCRVCRALVAPDDLDLATATWAAADHQAEHDEIEADEHEALLERERHLHLHPVEER